MRSTRRFRAVCPGVLSPIEHPYHYPGERPDICRDCRPKLSRITRFLNFIDSLVNE